MGPFSSKFKFKFKKRPKKVRITQVKIKASYAYMDRSCTLTFHKDTTDGFIIACIHNISPVGEWKDAERFKSRILESEAPKRGTFKATKPSTYFYE